MRKDCSVPVTVDQTEQISGSIGIQGIMDGLRIMKAWCDTNTRGWKYSPRACKFVFSSPEDATRFRAAFAKAFDIHPAPERIQ